MPKPLYVLTVTSRSGRRLPGYTWSSMGLGVYSDADLKRRLEGIAKDPDLTADVRTLTDEDV